MVRAGQPRHISEGPDKVALLQMVPEFERATQRLRNQERTGQKLRLVQRCLLSFLQGSDQLVPGPRWHEFKWVLVVAVSLFPQNKSKRVDPVATCTSLTCSSVLILRAGLVMIALGHKGSPRRVRQRSNDSH
jgi:hypothetical protein